MNLELLESRGRGEPPCSADVHNFECSTVRTSYHAADRLSVMYIQSKKDVGQGHACQVGTPSRRSYIWVVSTARRSIFLISLPHQCCLVKLCALFNDIAIAVSQPDVKCVSYASSAAVKSYQWIHPFIAKSYHHSMISFISPLVSNTITGLESTTLSMYIALGFTLSLGRKKKPRLLSRALQ